MHVASRVLHSASSPCSTRYVQAETCQHPVHLIRCYCTHPSLLLSRDVTVLPHTHHFLNLRQRLTLNASECHLLLWRASVPRAPRRRIEDVTTPVAIGRPFIICTCRMQVAVRAKNSMQPLNDVDRSMGYYRG